MDSASNNDEDPPGVCKFFNPNPIGGCEIDFNNYAFFRVVDGNYNLVKYKDLRRLLLTPENEWPLIYRDLRMVEIDGEDNGSFPAYLPNLMDLVGITNVKTLMRELKYGNHQYRGWYPIIPEFLMGSVDPVPNLNVQGPVYAFGADTVLLKIAPYSDAIKIFQVNNEFAEIDVGVCKDYFEVDGETRRMWKVEVRPLSHENIQEEAPFVKYGMKFVVWNSRNVGRPSFKLNLNSIMAVHNPSFIVLTETRQSDSNVAEVVKQCHVWPNISLEVDPGKGVMGGAAVMWNSYDLDVDANAMQKNFLFRLAAGVRTKSKVENASVT